MEDAKERKYSWVTTFLWRCSGADVKILRQLPSESFKYQIAGGTILLTGILGFVTGCIIFFGTFHNYLIAGLFATIWGALLFSLEKLSFSIVERAYDRSSKFIYYLLSIFLSFFVALQIGIPISVVIFEETIEVEIASHRYKRTEQLRYVKSKLLTEIDMLGAENAKMLDSVHVLRMQYMDELRGKNVRNTGHGPVASFKLSVLEDATNEYRRNRIFSDSMITLKQEQIVLVEQEIATLNNQFAKRTFITTSSTLFQLMEKESAIGILLLGVLLVITGVFSIPVLAQFAWKDGVYQVYIRLMEDQTLFNRKEANLSSDIADREKIKIYENESTKFIIEQQTASEESQIRSQRIETKKSDYERTLGLILESFVHESKKNEEKARTFFTIGLVASIVGIVVAFSFLVFWLNYFAVNSFEVYHISGIVSAMLITIFIEFIGAWFLKQHKIISDKSIYIIKIKASLSRYLMSYFAIKEFSNEEKKAESLTQLLETLKKDLNFPMSRGFEKDNNSFALEAMNSISSLTEAITRLSNEKKGQS